jgi:hypothetical protein
MNKPSRKEIDAEINRIYDRVRGTNSNASCRGCEESQERTASLV